MIIIKDIINTTTLKKKSNGVNIFNFMKSEVNKDKDIKKFQLDFTDIKSVSPFVFLEMFKHMQTKLNGQYVVEIINANPLIVNTYNAVVKGAIR